MLVSERLTVGQITFILRAAIQVLTFGGLLLIPYIILASSPRVASLRTHDTVNRILSKYTATKTAALWIIEALRGRNTDPILPRRLLLAILLSFLLGVFSGISDLGFLGFYACPTPGPGTLDKPSSITSRELAAAAINASMAIDTDPATVTAYRFVTMNHLLVDPISRTCRCDYAEEFRFEFDEFNASVTRRVCQSWHNSTFADPAFFSGLNMTDSDVLIPRQLRKYSYKRDDYLRLNSYYIGLGIKRTRESTISNGVMVNPHDMGLKAVFGVPQLGPQARVSLNEAMALEVEMGCMDLGIYSRKDYDDPIGGSFDIFATDSSWRKYHGPGNLYDILSKAVDDLRTHFRPLFNESSIDSRGSLVLNGGNSSFPSSMASIQLGSFPIGGTFDSESVITESRIENDCAQAIRKKFGIEPINGDYYEITRVGGMCSMLSISGSSASEGYVYQGLSRMVCATTTQLNLVSTVIETTAEGQVNFTTFDRLPSDLNYVYASLFDVIPSDDGGLIWAEYKPIERYILTPNPSSESQHYVLQRPSYSIFRVVGAGSAGGIITCAGDAMLGLGGLLGYTDSGAIAVLDEGTRQISFDPSIITKWGGEVGASFILESIAFNGWAAYQSAPIQVESTGGKIATCYRGLYVLGFAPLLVASLVVIGWMVFILVASGGVSALRYGKQLEELYSGMSPFWGVVCPTTRAQDAYLFWEDEYPAGPQLALAKSGIPNDVEERERTAVEFLAQQDKAKK
ncbi:hypothetical protein VNI00_018891 [Paramarasmius palmivorus]|uniref:Uncharacterized protein n=1 Tax=Paramarasmius palmivorus TaxID=297713 RepID=A0AAW0AUS2_9AGAR